MTNSGQRTESGLGLVDECGTKTILVLVLFEHDIIKMVIKD